MTSGDDNLKGRKPQRKTTSKAEEDNLTRRRLNRKKTTFKEELEERQPHRQMSHNLIG